MDELLAYLSMDFVQRALVVGVLVSLCAALLGVILVLKNYSLIGHGLADVGFAALTLALALGLNPIAVSMPTVILASVIIMAYSQKKGASGDSAIGIAATASLAVGGVITYLSKGFNMDVGSYLFGSILSLEQEDVTLSLLLALLVLGLFVLLYNRLFLITCDEGFARATGVNVSFYQFIISFLTAITVVIGMRIVGTLLISSLIIFPAVTAKKLTKSFRGMVLVSGVVSAVCFLLGMLVSLTMDLPSGASIVLVNVAVLALSGLFSKLKIVNIR